MYILIGTDSTSFSQKYKDQILNIHPSINLLVTTDPSESDREKVEVLIPIFPLDKVDKQLFPHLKWIHTTTAGINGLSKEILDSDIIVTNSSGVHPIPIAEQIFTYMLMFARGMHLTMKKQMTKTWDKEGVQTFELHGKTIGIIGLGRIGEKTAELAKGFGMNVLAVKTKITKEKHVDEVFLLQDLAIVLKKADFIINCLPGTAETTHLFGREQFNIMQSTSYFINIGRGISVKEEDLIEALQNHVISGAGLDVFSEEPLPKESPLWDLENVIITPHSAGKTPYYFDRVVDIFCQNLTAYLTHQPLPNEVNKQKGY